MNEAQTRKDLIDPALRDAGWVAVGIHSRSFTQFGVAHRVEAYLGIASREVCGQLAAQQLCITSREEQVRALT